MLISYLCRHTIIKISEHTPNHTITQHQIRMAEKPDESLLKVKEFEFRKIPKTTKWQDIKKTLYDPDKREVFGRTKKSWYQLLIFYTIFYACLAALFAICMEGLLASLSDKEPTWKLSESLIGTNPGLGFRPISNNTDEGSLVWYNTNDTTSVDKWVHLVDKFLEPYLVRQEGANYQTCSHGTPLDKGKVCTFDVRQFGPCSRSNKYGYGTNSPCVFLKLNRIYGWVPEYYTTPEEDMPDDLKVVVEDFAKRNEKLVWISCEGQHDVDKEMVNGFRYFPSQGFPGYYFPYLNDRNYLSPLIAVQIMGVSPSTIVNVECRAWAKNIEYSGSAKDRKGSVHFEILIDNN